MAGYRFIVVIEQKDAIRLHIQDRLVSGEEIPRAKSVSLTALEVAV